jgi:hypothetical protein
MNTLEFCEKYLENYTINPDGTIDVNGDVKLSSRLGFMTQLPVKFGKVSGDFICNVNKLTTLEGCPNYVEGDFRCEINDITSLEHCPKYVGGRFGCSNTTSLTTLKGIGKCEIIDEFWCINKNIPPENYIYILTAKVGGDIYTGELTLNNILNTYKNEVKYLHKALSELKKVII